jgi:hypothetical protein
LRYEVRSARVLEASTVFLGGLVGCQFLGREGSPTETPTDGATETPTETPTEEPTETPTEEPAAGRDVTVRQDAGTTFYWVLPGERRLSPAVFGTPDDPRYGTDWLEHNVEMARQAPPETVPQLLQDLPFLVAAPENVRAAIDDPVAHEKLTAPTLYNDRAKVTSGEFEVVYRDRQP